MSTTIVQSISDEQLAVLEEYLAAVTVPESRTAEVKIGELRGLIARLRAAEADAKRYRWLTEDHDEKEKREACRALCERLPVMSYSAASDAIDAAMERTP